DDISAFLRSTTSQFFEGRGMGMMGGGMGGRGMMGGGMHGEGMSGGGMHGGGMGGGGMGQHGGGMGDGGMGQHGGGATLRILKTGLLLFLALNTVNLASAESGSHETAYAEALHRVVTAQDLLLEEMRKIQSGEVAHYDFLQHAHIELLRDARGMRHSPASLPAVKRTALQEQAAQVLQLAGAMEWTLADFLRSHAQISGALASTIDL
ncbi:unnamed protein product, partial [Discosporangium mesarthrocarpum]